MTDLVFKMMEFVLKMMDFGRNLLAQAFEVAALNCANN